MTPLPPVADERNGPKVIRAGELPLPLATCSAQDSGLCTSLGQHSTAGPEGVDVES